jgi:hypothetical protein
LRSITQRARRVSDMGRPIRPEVRRYRNSDQAGRCAGLYVERVAAPHGAETRGYDHDLSDGCR